MAASAIPASWAAAWVEVLIVSSSCEMVSAVMALAWALLILLWALAWGTPTRKLGCCTLRSRIRCSCGGMERTGWSIPSAPRDKTQVVLVVEVGAPAYLLLLLVQVRDEPLGHQLRLDLSAEVVPDVVPQLDHLPHPRRHQGPHPVLAPLLLQQDVQPVPLEGVLALQWGDTRRVEEGAAKEARTGR